MAAAQFDAGIQRDESDLSASEMDGKPYGDKVVDSGHDLENFLTEEDISTHYDLSGRKTMIIFNHFQYKKTQFFGRHVPSPRKGTKEDVKRLREVFEEIGFKVILHQDLDYEHIIDVIMEVSTADHKETSCLIIVILTHGAAGGVLAAADCHYDFKDVLTPFYSQKCTLVGVPKLFFIQACRGVKLDSGRIMYDGEKSNSFLGPTHADFLIMYSTVEDHVSWRDIGGSWMIQELCNAVEKHRKYADLLHIITFANQRVAFDRISYNLDKEFANKKAVPETQFTLTKILKF